MSAKARQNLYAKLINSKEVRILYKNSSPEAIMAQFGIGHTDYEAIFSFLNQKQRRFDRSAQLNLRNRWFGVLECLSSLEKFMTKQEIALNWRKFIRNLPLGIPKNPHAEALAFIDFMLQNHSPGILANVLRYEKNKNQVLFSFLNSDFKKAQSSSYEQYEDLSYPFVFQGYLMQDFKYDFSSINDGKLERKNSTVLFAKNLSGPGIITLNVNRDLQGLLIKLNGLNSVEKLLPLYPEVAAHQLVGTLETLSKIGILTFLKGGKDECKKNF
ncbi:MAG: hypothetical protein AB8G05_09070 [Oligoflexales bacterium]